MVGQVAEALRGSGFFSFALFWFKKGLFWFLKQQERGHEKGCVFRAFSLGGKAKCVSEYVASVFPRPIFPADLSSHRHATHTHLPASSPAPAGSLSLRTGSSLETSAAPKADR